MSVNRRDLHREQRAHAATRKELARVEKAARVVEMKWQGLVFDLQDQLAKAQKRKPAKPKKVKPVERIVHVSNPADRVEIEALKAEVDRLTRELEAKA